MGRNYRMTSDQMYEYIMKNSEYIDPEICRVVEYLKPYYSFHMVNGKREESIKIIDARNPNSPSFSDYYKKFYSGVNDGRHDGDYENQRALLIARGKQVLDHILESSPEFKDEYNLFLNKLNNMPSDKGPRALWSFYNAFMIQIVYRCAEKNITYWGSLQYTTEVYKFLVDKIISEIGLPEKKRSSRK